MTRNTHVSNSHVDRNQRRIQAITRAAQRDLRSTEDQLALLDSRPGESQRERARLERAS